MFCGWWMGLRWKLFFIILAFLSPVRLMLICQALDEPRAPKRISNVVVLVKSGWTRLGSVVNVYELKNQIFPRSAALSHRWMERAAGRWREKTVSEGEIVVEQQKKKWRKEMNEDNGKSNFCITKHFALCVLQAENFDIAWVTTMGRMFFLPQARANEAQKGTEERLACIHSAQVEKCLVMKTTLDVCVLSSMEDSKRNSTQTPVGCCLCYTIPVDLGAT